MKDAAPMVQHSLFHQTPDCWKDRRCPGCLDKVHVRVDLLYADFCYTCHVVVAKPVIMPCPWPELHNA